MHKRLAPSNGRCNIQAIDEISKAVDSANAKLDGNRFAGFGAKLFVTLFVDTVNEKKSIFLISKAYFVWFSFNLHMVVKRCEVQVTAKNISTKPTKRMPHVVSRCDRCS